MKVFMKKKSMKANSSHHNGEVLNDQSGYPASISEISIYKESPDLSKVKSDTSSFNSFEEDFNDIDFISQGTTTFYSRQEIRKAKKGNVAKAGKSSGEQDIEFDIDLLKKNPAVTS